MKRNDLRLKSWIENSPASRVLSGDVNGNGKLQQNATRKTKENQGKLCNRKVCTTPGVSFGRLQLCMQPRYMSWCRKVLTILSWSLWFFMHIYATRSCFLYFLVDLIFFLPRWHRALRFGFSPKDGSVEEQLERPAVGHQIWLWPRYFRADMAEVLALAPETCFFSVSTK